MDYEKRVQAAIREMVVGGCVESAHDLSDGGLAVALAECSAGGVGAAISIEAGREPAPLVLFHEGPSRILVSTAAPDVVERIARDHGVEAVRIGVTIKERLRIDHNDVTMVDLAIERLREAREDALEEQLTTKSHA
jgi:phosphoribosylformylglycinamidine synthase